MIQVSNLYLYARVATIQSDSITPNLAQPRIPDKWDTVGGNLPKKQHEKTMDRRKLNQKMVLAH